MQFAALPPEINSTRMYSGPGSGPLLAAATAWNRLAATLQSTAAAYSSAVSTLTSQGWQGPASMAMTAAVTPYVEWLTTSAARAEQTAAQAGAAANAFNQAFAMTVPPPVVAANRSQLASLVATNILGQNTPVIAANEAHYGEMWAQDVAAMESYAAQSTAASALTPFTPPAQAANPAQAGPIMINLTRIRTILALIRTITLDEIGTIIPISGLGSFAVALVALQRSIAKDDGEIAATPPPREVLVSQGEGGGLVRPGAGGAPGVGRGGAVSAGAGRAVLVNGLSVPQQWAVPPEMRQLARALPITSTAAAPAAGPAAGESPYAGVGLAGMAGGGMGGLAGLGAAASANTASTPAAAANVAPQRAVKPAANAPAKPAAGTVTIPTENVAEHLANTLAAIPGATVVVIPPTAPSQ